MVGLPTNGVRLAVVTTLACSLASAQPERGEALRGLPRPAGNSATANAAAGIPPTLALGSAIALVVMIAFFLWSRERRLSKYRERLRRTYKLGEEILGAPSAESVLKCICETLPEILHSAGAQMYVHNRGARALDSVAAEGAPPVSYPLAAASSGEGSPAVVWCFEYRAALTVPDVARSPFAVRSDVEPAPQSLLFVPMWAQGEVVGVLELDRHGKARAFPDDDQELAQHLANQAGVAIRLLDQRIVQEQLFRTEK